MRLSQRAVHYEAAFDLTPMIDVVFLLIIFFSLTSQFSAVDRTAVDLPREAGSTRTVEAPSEIVIDMDATGALTVDGRSIAPDALRAAIDRHASLARSVREEDGSLAMDVLVRADRRCRNEHLDALGRVLADAGVRRWKLATAGGT